MNLPDTVDVLILGFGPAGASAAIAAHDAGAQVAIVEKAAAGGGNCVHSGGFIFEVDALCFGQTDRSVLRAFAAGLPEIPGWIESLGGATAAVEPTAFGGMLPSWPHFPGAGHVNYRQCVPAGGEAPGRALWRVLEASVARRGIPVAPDSAAETLIVEDGAVRGAIVSQAGGLQ